jgi:hypothetical protein
MTVNITAKLEDGFHVVQATDEATGKVLYLNEFADGFRALAVVQGLQERYPDHTTAFGDKPAVVAIPEPIVATPHWIDEFIDWKGEADRLIAEGPDDDDNDA